MPRSSGVMTLASGNPVASNTPISSTWANSTLADIASEITNSLPRDGSAPMTQALKLSDGVASAPSLTFNSDAATGVYKPSNGVFAIVTNGVERARIDGTGNFSTSTGNITASGSLTAQSGITTSTGNITAPAGSLGVGLANPSYPLHVYRNAAGTYGSVYIESGVNAQYAPRITLSDNRTGQSGKNWTISSGGAASGALVFQDDTAGSARMILDATGNISVGSSSTYAGSRVLSIQNTDAGSTSNAVARLTSNDGNLWIINGSTASGGGSTIYSDNSSGQLNLKTYNAIPVTFGTANTERMRIDGSGNVGIGTNNPNQSLVVYRGSGSNQIVASNSGTTGSDSTSLSAYTNGYSTNIRQYGNGPSYLYSNGTSLYIGTTSNSYVTFATNDTERARITADGKFGFGTTGPAARVHSLSSGFVPSNSTVATSASYIAEGSYGGGYLMKDGANYLGAYSIGGQYNIGLGTASGLQTAFAVASTNLSIVNPGAIGYGQLSINGATGTDRGVMVQTNGSSRWQIGANIDAESTGLNVGSNLAFHRYSDSGIWLGAPIIIQRSTGQISTNVENSSVNFRAYSARVFANFNGAGSVGANQTIRSSGGVTSIYKNATGDYTINFSESQYDSNYSLVGTASGGSSGSAGQNTFVLGEHWTSGAATLRSTTQIRVVAIDNNTDSAQEATSINFAIFR